ncbi:MAG TPA: hypothetical protein VFQ73_19180 [Flavisolibacter sp.]|nr:hypothetical protein [Flavisolibacter sp.]
MKVPKKIWLFTILLIVHGMACAQSTKISVVEVYGNRKTGSDRILSYINTTVGDSINPASFETGSIIAVLKTIPGIKQVTVNPVCCDAENAYTVYIGISESDSTILKYRPTPGQNIRLSNEIIESYKNFNQQVRAAALKGESSEDYFEGYSLLTYQAARKEQSNFIVFAQEKFKELEKVLKYSKHAEHRAAAAQIIAYSAKKKLVAENLLYAIKDPDENVRNNATRAIGVLAAYLSESPETKIAIPAAPFIDMLNSVSWTDRNKGAMVLAELTRGKNKDVLEQIKKQALPSVIEMARWKNRGHAFFSFIILCRMAGKDESSMIEGNFSNNWAELVEDLIKQCSI